MPSSDVKYIGLDVHKEAIAIAEFARLNWPTSLI
jgi:hypothetical protein